MNCIQILNDLINGILKKVSVKGMRHKAGGRKAGERRPVLSSAGIRAGANTVVQESPV
jgi:hypothetical protein